MLGSSVFIAWSSGTLITAYTADKFGRISIIKIGASGIVISGLIASFT